MTWQGIMEWGQIAAGLTWAWSLCPAPVRVARDWNHFDPFKDYSPSPPICHHLTSSRLYLAPSNFLNDDWDAQRIVQCLIYLVRRVNVCDTNLDSIYSLGSMYLPNTRIHYLLSMFSPRDKLSLLDLGCFQKLLSGDIFCRLNTNEWNVRGEQTLQGSELWESELLEDIYSQTLYQLPSPRR